MKENYYNIPRGNSSYWSRLWQLIKRYIWYLILVTLALSCSPLWLFNDQDSYRDNQERLDRRRTVIVVLGGGLTSDGKVPLHTDLRIQRAISLYKDLKEKEHAKIITLSGGTTHKPNPRDEEGFVIWEASAAAKKIIELGVDEEDVYEENFSLDTIGNAYFLRSIHLTPGRFTKAIIITNDWHMGRTKSIFETVLTLPQHKHEEDEDKDEGEDQKGEDFDEVSDWGEWWFPRKVSRKMELIFEPVESGIADQAVLSARIQREKESLQSFERNLKKKWHSFTELHKWLFTEHDAYASKRLKKKRKKIDNAVLNTY